MSVLVVGLSHKSAPVAVLERAAVSGDTVTKLLRDVVQAAPSTTASGIHAGAKLRGTT